jgi:uncharacterized protein YndB with AHSA1/START domain
VRPFEARQFDMASDDVQPAVDPPPMGQEMDVLTEDFKIDVILPVPPSEAWEALTDFGGWLTESGSLELKPGGAVAKLAGLRGGGVRLATVADVEPGKHLSFWWRWDNPNALWTHVKINLVDLGDKTLVDVVETGENPQGDSYMVGTVLHHMPDQVYFGGSQVWEPALHFLDARVGSAAIA